MDQRETANEYQGLGFVKGAAVSPPAFCFPGFPLPVCLPIRKNVEARTRSPLRIRASTVATYFANAQ